MTKLFSRALALLVCCLLMNNFATAASIHFDRTSVAGLRANDRFTNEILASDFTDGSTDGELNLRWDANVLTINSLNDVELLFPGDVFVFDKGRLDTNAGHLLNIATNSFSGTANTSFSIAKITFTAVAEGLSRLTLETGTFSNELLNVWTDASGQAPSGPAGGGDDDDDDLLPVGFTEDALAAEFSTEHGEDWRHVAIWGAWLTWNGARWEREGTLRAFDLARHICRATANRSNSGKVRTKLSQASTVAAVAGVAACVPNGCSGPGTAPPRSTPRPRPVVPSPLTALARARGFQADDGLAMLIAQAALSLAAWSGLDFAVIHASMARGFDSKASRA